MGGLDDQDNAPGVVRLRAHVPSNELEVARLKKLGVATVDILVKGPPPP